MKTTQHIRILTLLRSRKDWTPLPDILALGCAQYGARILELRQQGYDIQNRTEWVEGQRRSWFKLISEPENEPPRTELEQATADNNLAQERQCYEHKNQFAFLS